MQIIFSRIGQWCTLCLFNALLMLIPLPLAIDEVTASLQYLRSKQKPLFALLIQGGGCPEAKEDTRCAISISLSLGSSPLLLSIRKGPIYESTSSD